MNGHLYVCKGHRLILFLLDIVLAVLLRITDSDYPFGIVNPILPPGTTVTSIVKFEDTKGAIIIRISKKKNRQHNGQKKKVQKF